MNKAQYLKTLITFCSLFIASCSIGSKRMLKPNYYSNLIHHPVETELQGVAKSNLYENNEQNPKSNAFQILLKKVLNSKGLLDNKSKYKLVTEVIKIDVPVVSQKFLTRSIISYKVIDSESKNLLYSKLLTSAGSINFTSSLLGRKRAHYAINESLRQNILKFLDSYSNQTDNKKLSVIMINNIDNNRQIFY